MPRPIWWSRGRKNTEELFFIRSVALSCQVRIPKEIDADGNEYIYISGKTMSLYLDLFIDTILDFIN